MAFIDRVSGNDKSFHFSPSDTGSGALKLNLQKFFKSGANLTRPGILSEIKTIINPLLDAGRAAFTQLPLDQASMLAKATHDSYFYGADHLEIAKPDSIFVDPNIITKNNVAALLQLLTSDGQNEAMKFVSGEYIGKAFIVPNHILPGKVNDFLGFFGKNSPTAIAGLQQLVDDGNEKKKVANNQAMDWDTLSGRVGQLYSGNKKDEMMRFETGLQTDAILNSAIILAAHDLGLVPQDARYARYHEIWGANGNDWQAMAKVNYGDLDSSFGPGTANKDNLILDSHTQMSQQLQPVTDAIKKVLEG